MDEMFDELISELNPEFLDPEFIVSVCVIDVNGGTQFYTGEEFTNIIKGSRDGIYDVRVRLDVRKIRRAFLNEMRGVLERINARLAASAPPVIESNLPEDTEKQ